MLKEIFYLSMEATKNLKKHALRISHLGQSKLRKIAGRKRNIRLIGWHGFGASGDDLLGICVKQVLTSAAQDLGIPIEFTNSPDADLIVVGGGTLLGYDSMNIFELAKGSNAPLVFFGGGFRREQRRLYPMYQKRFVELMKRASLKGVRGYISKQLFIHNGITDVEVIGDPGLLFDATLVEPLKGDFKIGVVVRNMGKTGESQYVTNEKMQEIIAQVCDFLAARHNAAFYFFDLAKNRHDSDAEGARNTIAKMKRSSAVKEIVYMHGDPLIDFSYIGQMDYLVSQRLHPTLIAWLQKKPCVAFDYQFMKNADFMNSIGMDEFVIRTDEFHIDIYETKFNRLMTDRDLIIEHSQASIEYWKKKLQNFARRTISLVA